MSAPEDASLLARVERLESELAELLRRYRPVTRLGIAEVERRVGWERSTIYRHCMAGTFPQPEYLGTLRTWRVEVIEQWEREQAGRPRRAARGIAAIKKGTAHEPHLQDPASRRRSRSGRHLRAEGQAADAAAPAAVATEGAPEAGSRAEDAQAARKVGPSAPGLLHAKGSRR